MKEELLATHVRSYLKKLQAHEAKREEERRERQDRIAYYQSWTADRLRAMTAEELLEYLSQLWAMLIWGNKQYVVDKLIEQHGLDLVRDELSELIWGKPPIDARWDRFRSRIKGIGPAMMSELLTHVHPDQYLLWNRRAYVGLNYLGVPDLPRHSFQLTGKRYKDLCALGLELTAKLKKLGVPSPNLLDLDYFIWEELQVAENLSAIHKPAAGVKDSQPAAQSLPTEAEAEFLHDDIKEKVAEIGQWLGFSSRTEVKVADGSKVDAIWESTIGNMGRVIYVFEVQTKGSIDSLLMNLLKALNNAAVQGVVAVSDAVQLERIKKHAAGVAALRDKLRYWEYTEVLTTHESLADVNESINKLGLVPQGFTIGR